MLTIQTTNKTMNYKIEKNIPVPPRRGKFKYPLGQMKIGDSFFVKQEDSNNGQIRFASSYFAKRNKGYLFTVRKVEGGFRVWRIPAK
jgi:hypothetical protein